MFEISITMSMKIINSRLQLHLPGANELCNGLVPNKNVSSHYPTTSFDTIWQLGHNALPHPSQTKVQTKITDNIFSNVNVTNETSALVENFHKVLSNRIFFMTINIRWEGGCVPNRWQLANTERCCYNAVNFLPNPHNRYPIARPSGWAMRCLLWF